MNDNSPVSESPGRVLYLDPWGGVAGDMLLAALVDLDWQDRSDSVLRRCVEQLGLGEVALELEEVVVRGFRARRLTVRVPPDQPARSPAELDSLLAQSLLSDWVKERSRAALRRLALVEAGLHGISPQEVHFHEIGAVDTLVDVAGCFSLIEALGRPRVVHGAVPLGSGSVSFAHGTLPAPAPAALELLKGRACRGGSEEGETATPTGALLLAELADAWGPLPAMVPEKFGYGAGHKELTVPNLIRAVLGESTESPAPDGPERLRDEVLLLECAVDDAPGESIAALTEALRGAGALDVWLAPLIMKKGRPGIEVSLLASAGSEAELLDLLFSEGTTFGVRVLPVGRYLLAREWLPVLVGEEEVRVKIGRWEGRVVSVAPEYEEAAAVAARLGRPLKEVYHEAGQAARRALAEQFSTPDERQ